MMAPARGKKRKISKTKNESPVKIKKPPITDEKCMNSSSLKTVSNEQERKEEILTESPVNVCSSEETDAPSSNLLVVSDRQENDGGNIESQDTLKGNPELGVADFLFSEKQLLPQPNDACVGSTYFNPPSNVVEHQNHTNSPDPSQSKALYVQPKSDELKGFSTNIYSTATECQRERFLSASQPITSSKKFLGLGFSEKAASTKFRPPPKKDAHCTNSSLEFEPSPCLVDVEKTSDLKALDKNPVSSDSCPGPDYNGKNAEFSKRHAESGNNNSKVFADSSGISTEILTTTDFSDGGAGADFNCSITELPQTHQNETQEKVDGSDSNIDNQGMDELHHQDDKTKNPPDIGEEAGSKIASQPHINNNTELEKAEVSLSMPVADMHNDNDQTDLTPLQSHERQFTEQSDKMEKRAKSEDEIKQKTCSNKLTDIHSENSPNPMQTQGFVVGVDEYSANSSTSTSGENDNRDDKTPHPFLKAAGNSDCAEEPLKLATMFKPQSSVLEDRTDTSVAQLSFSPLVTHTQSTMGSDNKLHSQSLASATMLFTSAKYEIPANVNVSSPVTAKHVGDYEKSESCYTESMNLKKTIESNKLSGIDTPSCSYQNTLILKAFSNDDSSDSKIPLYSKPSGRGANIDCSLETKDSTTHNDLPVLPDKAQDTNATSTLCDMADHMNALVEEKKQENQEEKENVIRRVAKDSLREVSKCENVGDKNSSAHLKDSDFKPQGDPLKNSVSARMISIVSAQTSKVNNADTCDKVQGTTAQVETDKNTLNVQVNEISANTHSMSESMTLSDASDIVNYQVQKECSNLKDNFNGSRMDAAFDRTSCKSQSDILPVAKPTSASIQDAKCNVMEQGHYHTAGNLVETISRELFTEMGSSGNQGSGECASLNDKTQLYHSLPGDKESENKDNTNSSHVQCGIQPSLDELDFCDLEMQTLLFETGDADLENTDAELFEQEFQKSQAVAVKQVNARKAEGTSILQGIMGDLVSMNKQIMKMKREMDIVSKNLGRVSKQNESSKDICTRGLFDHK